MPDILYQFHEPYPVPTELPHNHRWALALADPYSGGQNCELTAVTQYIYHHMALADSHPELSAALRRIAVVEMRHLDALGTCVRRLGMQPRYLCRHRGRPQPWNAGLVHYGDNPADMLRLDIAGEEQAIQGYRHAMRLVPHPGIQALLDRLLHEEELHIQILSSLLASL